jgi:hypothetical protein
MLDGRMRVQCALAALLLWRAGSPDVLVAANESDLVPVSRALRATAASRSIWTPIKGELRPSTTSDRFARNGFTNNALRARNIYRGALVLRFALE